MIGKKFGFLTVTRSLPLNKWGHKQWLCICVCSNEIIASTSNLNHGDWKSCGCKSRSLKRKNATKHGMSAISEYRVWKSMISRCTNKNTKSYARYGGRGIEVCARWRKSFSAFYADVGPRPSLRHTLDRFPNGDGNYEPSNCRWATPYEQISNKGNRIIVKIPTGESVFLVDAADRLGVSYWSAYRRYKSGSLSGSMRRDGAVKCGAPT